MLLLTYNMGTVPANKELDYGKGSTSFSLKSVFYADITPCFDLFFYLLDFYFFFSVSCQSIIAFFHTFFILSLCLCSFYCGRPGEDYCDSTTLNFFSVFAFLLVLSLDTFFATKQ